MQAPDLAVKEMYRCVNELGFPGVQIGSHVNEWDLNAPELYDVYAVSKYFYLYSRGFYDLELWSNQDAGTSSATSYTSQYPMTSTEIIYIYPSVTEGKLCSNKTA